jgi:hypothetical protein
MDNPATPEIAHNIQSTIQESTSFPGSLANQGRSALVGNHLSLVPISPYLQEPLRSARLTFTGSEPANGIENGVTNVYHSDNEIKAYRLVQNGSLKPDTVFQLVTRYAENFHPYLPLVPRKYFDPAALDSFASSEKRLLTAVLTIASKDLVDMPHVHECCSRYMHELISGIAAGADCNIEAVEALLVLAEWEPQGLRPRIEAVGRGEEDRAAWIHVGLALRYVYFGGLDRTTFRNGSSVDAQNDVRRRLAWTSCYISDRLISVRIGQPFGPYGLDLLPGIINQDFPSLHPLAPGDEDYAKIFQATVELTQLYERVHRVLYSGMLVGNKMLHMGDYVEHVDDFRVAISHWNHVWSTLTCEYIRFRYSLIAMI